MGRQAKQGSLFYEFGLDDRIPADHLLRRVDERLGFAFVRKSWRSITVRSDVRRSIQS